MAKVAIVTDSSAYIPKEYKDKYKILEVPLVVIWGNQTYEDGVTIQPEEFYKRLSTAKEMPTTSQASVIHMHNTFSGLVDQGYDVLGVFIGAKLSGTLSSAYQGRSDMASGQDKVEIFDSDTVAMALGFQALAAAEAAMDGASLAECKAVAQKAKDRSGVFFVVDTLEFLHRGGRIGGAARFLGSALNLKPILTIEDGKVEAVERIRTKTKASERVIDLIAERCKGKSISRLATLHANVPEEGQELLKHASDLLHPKEAIFSAVSPAIGTHTGPGTLGLAYITES